MKSCTFAVVLLVSFFATTMALPAKLSYYQQPSFYYQSGSAPQRLMYMQYVQQPSQTRSRLTNAAAAFVAGDTIATGAYLKDSASEEQQIVEESVLDNTGANGVQSVAEAYPADVEDAQDSEDVAQLAEAEVPAVPEVPEVPEVPQASEDNQIIEEEAVPVEDDAQSGREYGNEVPAEAAPEPSLAEPEISEASAVALPEEAENDDDDEDEEEDVPQRRQLSPKAAPAPLPAGTFFPIDFGGTSDGAIAIANSFSTGVSGSAKSQAIAYGSTKTSRSKSAPVSRH